MQMEKEKEDELILEAVKGMKNNENLCPKKSVYLFDEDDEKPEIVSIHKPDALAKIVRKEKIRTSHKKRPIADWTMTDHVYFLKSLLNPLGLTIESGSAQSANLMGIMYDTLIKYLGDDVSNYTLREYCEWWVSTYGAQYSQHRFYIQAMNNDKYLERFVNYYRSIVPVVEKKETVDTSSIEDIFKTGSLPMALMVKGIILSINFLQSKHESNIFSKIVETMRKFSKQAIEKTIEITIRNAPYPKSSRVDIGAMINGMINLHNLSSYKNYPWKNLFV